MPVVAGWVDEMRAAFGVDEINKAIRNGMSGKQTFHATENGCEIGTAMVSVIVINGCDMVVNKPDPDESGRAKKTGRFK